MQAVRRKSRTRRHKTAQQFFWVYGNYIAAGVLTLVILAGVTSVSSETFSGGQATAGK